VSCVSTTSCTVVGYYAEGPASHTLVLTGTFLIASPSTGTAGTAITVSGGGFTPGESVRVSYKTALSATRSVAVCTAFAESDGTFTCEGDVPDSADAGAPGSHHIVARGMTSMVRTTTSFTLESGS
jgi:hypothetical protein